ncbi:MAG: hypothetical protein GXX85_06090 [Ignavibacteria bacterium]|nr:hypothetical protein [Ignavibacteria bacterium]
MNNLNVLNVEKRRKAGHYEILGETYAKLEFFENGWNPYSRFLDIDKVDLIVRRRDSKKSVYKEIQVKYGKLYECTSKWEKALFDVTSWRFFKESEFDEFVDDPNFFIAYVLSDEKSYKGDIFIFPARAFSNLLHSAIRSKDKVKVYISRLCGSNDWVLRKVHNFSTIDNNTTINVSQFHRNFKLLLG